MKTNHRANVVRIKELLPHINADKLALVQIEGYQVVVQKETFKVGDLAVYIQPDSVVPQTEPFKWLWEGKIELDGSVSERNRRITVRRFRKEWSEGLLLPITDFHNLVLDEWETGHRSDIPYVVHEGDDVSSIIGITHYDPDKGKEATRGTTSNAPHRKYPKTLRGWFYWTLWKLGLRTRAVGFQLTEDIALDAPVYDVENFKNHSNLLQPGEEVIVSEKIHGSNARFVYYDGHMYAGSHHLWKHVDSNCIWRKAVYQNGWLEAWCRNNPGSVLYGEVVPTQKGFSYGAKNGEVKVLVFDIRTADGQWKKPFAATHNGWYNIGLSGHTVPTLYKGPFDVEKMKSLVDGPSYVPGCDQPREGIVITPINERRVPGFGRLQLKLVSNVFLEKS